MTWNVITAGPSAGKTSTINYLASEGFYTAPEAARTVIDQLISDGADPDTVKETPGFINSVIQMDKKIERNIPIGEHVFLDRSAADTIAYQRHFGDDVDEELVDYCERLYDNIFLLDILDFHDDYARTETEEEAHEIHNTIAETYTDLGYDVTTVPVMPIDQRVEYILHRL